MVVYLWIETDSGSSANIGSSCPVCRQQILLDFLHYIRFNMSMYWSQR